MQEENSTSWPFGQRLKEWGKATFGSMKSLAERLDISPPHLSAYISGARKPTLETLQHFRTLGADINYLLDGSSTDSTTLSSDSTGSQAASTPLLRPERVWAAIGNPDPETLSVRLGITPKRARDVLSGRAHLNAAELASLLDDVASIALISTAAGRSHSLALPAAAESMAAQA